MDYDHGLDFNFGQILKSMQAIENKNKKTLAEFNTAKSNLEAIKKELATAKAKFQEEDFKTNLYNNEIRLVEEDIPRKTASIAALTERIEENIHKTEEMNWTLAKSELVLGNEREYRKKYRKVMEARTAENALQMEAVLDGRTPSQIAAAAAERALKMDELEKRKEVLQKNISNIEKVLEGKKKSMSDMSSEASVLKKRNSAVMLRLRRKLQESEARRRGLITSVEELREIATRGRPSL